MRICLDTSAYSHFRRGVPEAVRAVTRARWVGMTAIVLGELRVGFRLGSRAVENEERLRQFLAEPVVAALDVDDEAAAHYADIVVELRRAGTPLPTNDIWIAALAAREGATVVTTDGHFDRIGRIGSMILPVEPWPRDRELRRNASPLGAERREADDGWRVASGSTPR